MLCFSSSCVLSIFKFTIENCVTSILSILLELTNCSESRIHCCVTTSNGASFELARFVKSNFLIVSIPCEDDRPCIADVLKGVSRIEDVAFDLQLKQDVKRCLLYVKLLDSFVGTAEISEHVADDCQSIVEARRNDGRIKKRGVKSEDLDKVVRKTEKTQNRGCSKKRAKKATEAMAPQATHEEKTSNTYVIEKICGLDNGKFLIKWDGYNRKTWESEDVINEADAHSLVREYKRQWNSQNPHEEQFFISDE
eukprot:Blabericola_migrator_1__6912@NODE_3501_length_1724_cov_20_010863_g2175_i0_p1_GENE_NODE_3501_length_1724_cov_20_010863_g2175_i0NODE_3501_length_1724_cov_20_010863_g2175_i0_p1_ORF_typecomplete_len252_score24_63Chromo/PF00385_24/4_5e05DMAP1/PF05499_12/0_15_NODE_3501_length_1724_cov_20_010863_g2175_i07781533